MDEEYYKKHIANIEDYPKKGVIFRDVTTTLEDAEAFQNSINDMYELIKDYDFDKIMCADARGFIFGSALAYKCNKGLIVARKPNKLPRPGFSYSYTLEYGENTLVISEGSLHTGNKILIVDDLLATGGSSIAMMELTKRSRAIPIASVFYIELPDLGGKQAIKKCWDIPVFSLVKYKGD